MSDHDCGHDHGEKVELNEEFIKSAKENLSRLFEHAMETPEDSSVVLFAVGGALGSNENIIPAVNVQMAHNVSAGVLASTLLSVLQQAPNSPFSRALALLLKTASHGTHGKSLQDMADGALGGDDDDDDDGIWRPGRGA